MLYGNALGVGNGEWGMGNGEWGGYNIGRSISGINVEVIHTVLVETIFMVSTSTQLVHTVR